MISLVTMATNVDSKLLTIVILFLSGTDHSVKVSSNSESVRAGVLLEFFGGYRELMLKCECRPENWITCSLQGLLKMHIKIIYDF